MLMNRRQFLQILAAASVAGFPLHSFAGSNGRSLYDLPRYGNVSLLHYTDCHGQLNPVYFREPNINIGVAGMRNQPPHLVGEALLKHFGIDGGGKLSHAFTYLDFVKAAEQYGRVGGFAHLSTLVKQMKASRPGALLLDGGDTWGGGTGTGVWTYAQDMVDAQKLLGVDVMTGHWEFTYGADRVSEIVENDFADAGIDFVAQNVTDVDWGDQIFKPYVIREINGVNVAIVGQAFPYTPIANPRFMVEQWTFGIRPDDMQRQVNAARAEGAEIVVVLSHNGMDVDLKMASMVDGIDAIFGGHTHDGVPAPTPVKTPNGGTCLVTNAGSNAKFLGVMDFDFRDGKIQGWKYNLLPVFSNLIEGDAEMQDYITTMRNQEVTFDGETFNMEQKLSEELAVTESLLFRRGNFNGTFDQLIVDALNEQIDAQIAFSPGFRWGTSVLPGMPITFEHVMDQTGLTYPAVTRNVMTGAQIKTILEDVADNLFHEDPFFQQGGDMVRVGGLKYAINPGNSIGERILEMEFDGKPLDPDKEYVVAGWASVQEQPAGDTGRKIWDVVTDYLRDRKTVRIDDLNEPVVKGVGEDNLGYVPTAKT
ncbi:Sulfur oxidation protein SoxB [Thioalkalivibrio nitratireducens DSM 14787]|uniref:Sulfur oxidation protein SoxB n=1 Tax=Thioalkalivibrio nitratireducens (strain DSM 14787 / UNIQEM 213 / ALEN2) TaxID=1255043 RepID=L0E2P8_THIND|nr:thiosulfohydrolase SoxB [Thioalkalivibrio nitratireducens]AGA34891.1 Sulfur oxidation protein SoxB [Thioalkalivibrio nitratireducens DSM 14787]